MAGQHKGVSMTKGEDVLSPDPYESAGFGIHPTVDGESAYYSEYPTTAACTIPTVAIPAPAALAAAVTLVAAATLAATTATPPAAATPPSPLPLLLSTAATVIVVGSGSLHHACGRHHCSAAASTDHIVAVASSGSGPSSTSRHHHCCHCRGRDCFVGVAKLPPFVATVVLEVVAVIVVAAVAVVGCFVDVFMVFGVVVMVVAAQPLLLLRSWSSLPSCRRCIHPATTLIALVAAWGWAWIAPPPRVVVVAAWGPHPTVGASSGIGNGSGDDGVVPGWSAEEAAGEQKKVLGGGALICGVGRLVSFGMQTTPPPAAGKQVTTMPLPPSPHLPLYYGCNHDGHEHTAGSELGLSPVNQGKAMLPYCCGIAHVSLQPPFIPLPHLNSPTIREHLPSPKIMPHSRHHLTCYPHEVLLVKYVVFVGVVLTYSKAMGLFLWRCQILDIVPVIISGTYSLSHSFLEDAPCTTQICECPVASSASIETLLLPDSHLHVGFTVDEVAVRSTIPTMVQDVAYNRCDEGGGEGEAKYC
ncbi:hypothetical protein EDB83DRAFT_2317252 [Lactarius deliciosus]|nr:hypothetical protein EDB83DRAFT_2317252 [Lactarius deliciosus]